jgi:hypothetical protein
MYRTGLARENFGASTTADLLRLEAAAIITGRFRLMSTTSAIIGYIASGLVLATFCTNDLRRLRTLAILSNIVFISYGALVWLPPVLGLHLLLLPINAIRLMRMSNTAPSADDHKLLPSKLAMRIGFDAAPPRAAGSGSFAGIGVWPSALVGWFAATDTLELVAAQQLNQKP